MAVLLVFYFSAFNPVNKSCFTISRCFVVGGSQMKKLLSVFDAI
jgi:hypothetical protein